MAVGVGNGLGRARVAVTAGKAVVMRVGGKGKGVVAGVGGWLVQATSQLVKKKKMVNRRERKERKGKTREKNFTPFVQLLTKNFKRR